MMRQHVKLTAVLAVVVLALTGFSSSTHGHGSKSRKSSSSSSGGGCSNSKKSNGTYHRSSGSYGSSGRTSSGSTSGTSTSTPSATATSAPRAYVFRCAQPAKGASKAVTTSTVRLTASASGSHTYRVDVNFLDSVGTTIDTGEATVQANGGQTKTVSVRMDTPSQVSRVEKCSVTAELSY
ncbi:hypothetical protein [Streptomyces sp. NPDC058382]|uniref:hypothetical protein n=1 Tax=unclassified Streptomyces TaxID=2593676 RepID=UPI003633C307